MRRTAGGDNDTMIKPNVVYPETPFPEGSAMYEARFCKREVGDVHRCLQRAAYGKICLPHGHQPLGLRAEWV